MGTYVILLVLSCSGSVVLLYLTSGHIQEQFVNFHEVSDNTSGERISTEILDEIRTLGLDPTKLRSQCYDGAGNE